MAAGGGQPGRARAAQRAGHLAGLKKSPSSRSPKGLTAEAEVLSWMPARCRMASPFLGPVHSWGTTVKFTYAPGAQPVQGYTIRRGLGRGGFGEVYLAVSDGGKEVALKLVQQHLEVELRGVGQCLNLKHPHLVVVHDILKAGNHDILDVLEHMARGRLGQG